MSLSEKRFGSELGWWDEMSSAVQSCMAARVSWIFVNEYLMSLFLRFLFLSFTRGLAYSNGDSGA